MGIESLDFSTTPPTEGTLDQATDAEILDGSIVLYPDGTGDGKEMTIAQLPGLKSGLWTPTVSNVQINGTVVANSVANILSGNWIDGGAAKHFELYFSITPPTGIVAADAGFGVTLPDNFGDIADYYGGSDIFINASNAFGSYFSGSSARGSFIGVSGDSPPFTRAIVYLEFEAYAMTEYIKFGVARGIFIT